MALVYSRYIHSILNRYHNLILEYWAPPKEALNSSAMAPFFPFTPSALDNPFLSL